MKTINIKVQGWDVNCTEFFQEIEIQKTNIRNMSTDGKKVSEYMDLFKSGSDKYPFVILEENAKYPGFFNIIDGAHRIKALQMIGSTTVKAILVINHNN